MNPAHFEAFIFLLVGSAGLLAIAIALSVCRECGLWNWTEEDEVHTRLWLLEQERRSHRDRP